MHMLELLKRHSLVYTLVVDYTLCTSQLWFTMDVNAFQMCHTIPVCVLQLGWLAIIAVMFKLRCLLTAAASDHGKKKGLYIMRLLKDGTLYK